MRDPGIEVSWVFHDKAYCDLMANLLLRIIFEGKIMLIRSLLNPGESENC